MMDGEWVTTLFPQLLQLMPTGHNRLRTIPGFQWRLDGDTLLSHCEWEDVYLIAGPTGSWQVSKSGTVITSHQKQAKGMNLEQAQRRAQAAAMCISSSLRS